MNSAGYQWEGADLILHVRVQPRASRDQWTAIPVDGRFRVHITAPPVDGKANTHLRAFLATVFRVAKGHVTLLAGETGREKRLHIRTPKQLPLGIDPPLL